MPLPTRNKYSDLKLIDELLCDLKVELKCSWPEMDTQATSAILWAMCRLREAWGLGEMPVITLGLANYFKSTGTEPPQPPPTVAL